MGIPSMAGEAQSSPPQGEIRLGIHHFECLFLLVTSLLHAQVIASKTSSCPVG